MKNKNHIIIGLLMMVIAIIIFGYAGMIKDLSTNRISLQGKEKWKIKILTVTKNKSLSNKEVIENEKPIINGSSISFDVSIPKPGLKVTYDVEITNVGTLTAKLNEISSLTQINSAKPTNIVYSVVKLNDKDKTLARLQKDYFRVTIESVADSTDIYTKPATIYFDYIQVN